MKSLQIFVAVSGSLSFTRTAAELHMSVSAVSRAILRLEEELGCRLFERNRRGMSATGAAVKLRCVAERMITDWRALQHSLGDGGTLFGDLTVFCSVTATHRLLSPLLAAYRERCPGVDVRLQTGDQADGVQRVRERSSDVAMIAQPSDLPRELEFIPLTESPLRLCVPRLDCEVSQQLAGKHGDELLRALNQVPWILPERGVSKDLIEEWLSPERAITPSVYARVAGHEAIAAMASLGLGVGIVPELVVVGSGVADALELHSLVGLPSIVIGLCVRRSRLDDPVVSSLWSVAQSAVRA